MLQLNINDYIVSPPRIAVDVDLSSARSRTEELRSLARTAAELAAFREALSTHGANFEKLLGEVERSEPSVAELEEAAELISEREKSAASALVPALEILEEALAQKFRPSQYVTSVRRLAEDGIDAARMWLEIFQNLRIRLLKLASDRRVDAGETGSSVMSAGAEMETYLRRIAGG